MKMILIMCEDTIADEVRAILSEFSGHEGCFLEIPRAHASIRLEKRMDSSAFPGTANLFLFPLEENKIESLKEKVQQFETSCPYQCCLKIMALNAEEIL